MEHSKIIRELTVDDLEIRRDLQGHRTVVARALTYDVPYRVSDDGGVSFYDEVWRDGVFAKSLNERGGREDRKAIPLLISHNKQGALPGVILGAEPSSREFVFRAKLYADTAEGIVDRIDDGLLSGISVGARPIQNRPIQRGIERVEAMLQEISLTPFNQMSDGQVLAVRADLGEQTTTEPVETPVLDEYRQYLDSIERP